MIEVQLEGAREAARALERAHGELDRLDETVGADVAEHALDVARWGAPRRTGTLAGSGYVDRGEAPAVVFGARYAPPVHSGVPSRNIAPQPFLDEAARRVQALAEQRLARAVDDVARRAN